jgi:dipeptidyl aminopeptidase/acylaminoacyl peptidase
MRRISGTLLIVITLLGLAGGAAAQEKPAVLPIEHFTKYDEFSSPMLSPDGTHIAYFTGKYGHSILAITTVADGKLVGGARCPDGFEVFDAHWKSNTRLVYQLAERQPGMARPTATGEIGALDIDGKDQRYIYGYRGGEMQTGTRMRVRQASYATPELVSPLLSDEKNILIAEYPWRQGVDSWFFDRDAKPIVTRLDVFTGRKHQLGRVPLANASLLVDAKDEVRFAVGSDARARLAVSWKPDAAGAWQEFELPGFKDESVIPQMFSEDNQWVYLTGVSDDDSASALYKIELATRAVTKVHGVDGVDVSSVMTDLTGRRIVGVITETDKPQVHWLDETDRATRIHRSISKALPGQVISIISTSQDGSRALIFTQSDVNPGDYYLFDTKAMKMNYLFAASKWIDPEQMHAKEPFVFKARDGVELHGYLTKPGKVGPFPTVVLPHGGPHGVRDSWTYDWEVQLLANRGYAVLQLNYRGSGGFGRKFEESGYHEWGGKMQDDITDATRWAIDNKLAAPDRICIYGASYGGYAALMGAVREPDLYRCAIGYAGVYDLELMLSSGDIPRSRLGRAYLNAALGDDVAKLRSRSPAFNAGQIKIPVLLIHGKEDWRADFKQAKNMKAALEASHKEFDWMVLSREGHGVYDEETRREVYDRILKFLDRHLQPRNPATAAITQRVQH